MRFMLRVRVTCPHSVAHDRRQALEEGDFAGVECPLCERLKQLVQQQRSARLIAGWLWQLRARIFEHRWQVPLKERRDDVRGEV